MLEGLKRNIDGDPPIAVAVRNQTFFVGQRKHRAVPNQGSAPRMTHSRVKEPRFNEGDAQIGRLCV